MMPALVHFRPSEPLSPTIYCPRCTESNLIVAHVRNDAKGPSCKIARNTDPLRGDFASNSDPS